RPDSARKPNHATLPTLPLDAGSLHKSATAGGAAQDGLYVALTEYLRNRLILTGCGQMPVEELYNSEIFRGSLKMVVGGETFEIDISSQTVRALIVVKELFNDEYSVYTSHILKLWKEAQIPYRVSHLTMQSCRCT
ncbi:MAG: hypothetical protein ACYCO5_15065, partial [Acidobacteriaceae bacterium]